MISLEPRIYLASRSPRRRELLTQMDCDELQGFLFCRPLPVDQLERHMTAACKAGSSHRATGWDSIRGLLQAN